MDTSGDYSDIEMRIIAFDEADPARYWGKTGRLASNYTRGSCALLAALMQTHKMLENQPTPVLERQHIPDEVYTDSTGRRNKSERKRNKRDRWR